MGLNLSYLCAFHNYTHCIFYWLKLQWCCFLCGFVYMWVFAPFHKYGFKYFSFCVCCTALVKLCDSMAGIVFIFWVCWCAVLWNELLESWFWVGRCGSSASVFSADRFHQSCKIQMRNFPGIVIEVRSEDTCGLSRKSHGASVPFHLLRSCHSDLCIL